MQVKPSKLAEFNRPVPRYTSYPTAPEWEALQEGTYREHLAAQQGPLSLYIHIPFCHSMCLYCACSVVLNRRPENEERYVQALLREIEMVHGLTGKRRVTQLHFGGGTPTKLSDAQLSTIMDRLHLYDIDGEIAMEIDPRTVNLQKLQHLKSLGFNRVSFGVQDTNAQVQEAVKRRQSAEMSRATVEMAREVGFSGINIDLIYGLPHQTQETFRETVDEIIAMRPNRIALFSYAKVPWLKSHQKAIKDETLPSTEEKFAIYANAREQFIAAGYIAIGMDHFALPDDPIAKAFRAGELQRNFQGYSLQLADDLIGLGMSSTGFVGDAYFQNEKDLVAYHEAIAKGRLPVFRGKLLSEDDKIRRWTIGQIMCNFQIDKGRFEERFGIPFDTYFSEEQGAIEQLIEEGLITEDLHATLYGSLFIRNVASTFDAYFKPEQARFSKAV
jgi:oxygen-independent coproporphyrinogen III oxidase